MKPNASITAELQQLAPHFPEVSRQMPHAVPEHYFDELPLQALRRVAPAAAASPAGVPEGYFDQLPLLMLQKVRQHEVSAELQDIAPLLNTLSKAPVGYVPPGYFEQPIASPAATPVHSLGGARVSLLRRLAPLAAAACLALGLWLGYGWYQQQPSTDTDALADAPQIEEALKNLDDQTIASYLETTSATGSYTNPEAGLDENVELMLQDIQSETIEQYLHTMPTLVPGDKTDM